MKATDKIMLFKPARIAELIGDPDALTVLKACWQRAADSVWEWAMTGDISQPWCYAEPAARGQVLVDYRSEQISTEMHRADEDRASPLRKIMSLTGFEGRQFHRDEIARWLDAMDIDSDYAFGLSDTPSAEVEAGTDGRRWDKESVTEAWRMKQRLKYEECRRSFWPELQEEYGVTRQRLEALFAEYGLK